VGSLDWPVTSAWENTAGQRQTAPPASFQSNFLPFSSLTFPFCLQFIAKVLREYTNFFSLIQATVRSSGHQASVTWPRDGLAAHQANHRQQPATRRMKSLSFRCRQVPNSFQVQIFLSMLGWKMKQHEETATS
jgi:hypothetical protein